MTIIKKKISTFLAFSWFWSILMLMPSFAQGDEAQEIRNILDERDQQIKEILGPRGTTHTEEQREQLKSIINDIVDYPAMAEYALHTIYDTLSTEERQEFVELFSEVIRRQSIEQLDIYRAEVQYDEITVENGSAMVKTTVELDDTRTPVHYRMIYKQGEWMIADMAIDNVWTAESYRSSFQNIIRRRGFDALLASLQRRVER